MAQKYSAVFPNTSEVLAWIIKNAAGTDWHIGEETEKTIELLFEDKTFFEQAVKKFLNNEIVMPEARRQYQERVNGNLALAKERVEKFAKELVEDPVYALEWSDDVYRYGAMVSLYTRIFNGLANDCSLKDVVNTLEQEFLNMAKHIDNRSTGQGKNLLQDFKVAVWAKELEIARVFLSNEEKETQ